MLSSLVAVVGISALSAVTSDFHAAGAIEQPAPPPLETAEPAREPRLPSNAVFRHSVIPGGVFTADEVETAISRDGIVAAHYSGLNPLDLRVETLSENRAVYMSYRIGDDVLWTKRKVQLKQGETILTDGMNSIRARCGNRIALAPMEPTADDEPGEMEFDALTDPSDVVQSRIPQGSEGFRISSSSPLPHLLGDSPDGSSGNVPSGSGSSGIPVFGFGTEQTDSEVPGDPLTEDDLKEIVLFPVVDGELPSHGFPMPGGPLPSNPDQPGRPDNPEINVIPEDPSDPKDPEDPGSPVNPTPPSFENPALPVPEPATFLLVGGGLTALWARRRRR